MASPTQEKDQFKVLIAGGSLVGLGLALALEHAGIDFELFEKGEFAPQLGASIGYHPPGLRILDQLGVWEDMEKAVIPLTDRNYYDSTGRCFDSGSAVPIIQKILRRPTVFIERSKALKMLHAQVKDKSKLHDRNAIVGYEDIENGVVVTTADGQTHHGHILVGADGVHSTVKTQMAEKISLENPTLGKELHEGFTSEYNCIFGTSRNEPPNQLQPDSLVLTGCYDNYSVITASGEPGLVFWFIFEKAATITTTPDCPRFTDADADALIAKHGATLVGPDYTIQDLWDARVAATMVPLEEGVLKQWSHNRVVLIGDSVHKATINAGLGGQLGYEGIARFTNALVPLLKQHPIPSSAQITDVFNTYFTGQKPRADAICGLSAHVTRSEAQDTWFLKFASRNIVPWISDRVKATLFARFANSGPYLEWLPLPDVEVKLAEELERKKGGRGVVFPALTVLTVLAAGSDNVDRILDSD
ncbi:hypothetical protein BJX99DRAFT_245688 [Aspergillus californicus]